MPILPREYRVFSVEGELTPGKRIKCSHIVTTSTENSMCGRTHEVSAPRSQVRTYGFTEDEPVGENLPDCIYSVYMDTSGWYIMQTIQPVIHGRSVIPKTYYVAFDPAHVPEAFQNFVNGVQQTSTTAGETIRGLDIDFTSELSETPAEAPAVQVQPVREEIPLSRRSCNNCYWDRRICPTGTRDFGTEGMCCEGYGDDSFWCHHQSTREEAEQCARTSAATIRQRRIEIEQREAREAAERSRRESEQFVTGIWTHHKKGGTL